MFHTTVNWEVWRATSGKRHEQIQTRSPERIAVPAPVGGGNVGEVQVNPVRRHAEGFFQQTADLLRELLIHAAAQAADAADVHERSGTRFAGHEDGRWADDDHDILFRFADRPGHDFGKGREQRRLFVIGERNGGFEF